MLRLEISSDGPVNFSTQSHSKDLISLLSYIRLNCKLFDIRLNVNGSVIQAHKIVLCACSTYFRKMFLCGMRECSAEEISIQSVDSAALESIVDYAYTGDISISENNVEPLLAASVLLQVQSVTVSCCTFLENKMTPSNCIAIGRFASQNVCPECQSLWEKAIKYSFTRFSEVSKSQDFLQLNEKELVQILTNERLVTRCEAEVFCAVTGWIESDFPRRFDRFELLMSCVNFNDIPLTFLRKQLTNPFKTTQTAKCVNYVQSLIMRMEQPSFSLDCCHRDGPLKVIYTVGGYNVKSISLFECFCLSSKRWFRLPDIPVIRSGLCCAVTHQYLYVIGGKNGNFFRGSAYKSVSRYDPSSNCWQECCSMQEARHRAAVGVIDHQIYITGGFNDVRQLSSVEKYSPYYNQWTRTASMDLSRIGHGSAVVYRHLYVVGGIHDDTRLSSVARYSPDNDMWCEVAPIHFPRSGAGCCATLSHIYVVGGYDGENILSSVERYDPKTDSWKLMAPMPVPVSGLACTVVCPEIIFAFGGYNGREFVNHLQIYKIEKDEWTNQPTDNFGRTGHGVTIGNMPQIIHQMNGQNIYYMCDTTKL